MGYPEFRVIEEAIGWDPAEVTVPPLPDKAVAAPGGDPLSALVGAVMPNLANDVNKKVAEARAREESFASNLSSARTAYHGADSAGQDQINAAADQIDPADAFGAGAPVESANALSSGEGGFSQLTQLMGMAMQVGQQAAQMPMGAAGTVGQMSQPLIQGVQSIVQQAAQASEGSRQGGQGEGTGGSFDSGVGAVAPELKPEGGNHEENAAADGGTRLDEENDLSEDAAGADVGEGTPAPVDAPLDSQHVEQKQRHQRIAEAAPEVAL
ncbi:PE domain-containing protein [Mycolicibacterium goodii]|uniref:PE domain-containing protein n=1 Tax=Mycolicibacterium goodii TaxID=134601 RepID=A0ABS6HQR1_MYCGD|nr:PE domain-containing protein [Mycolicibacterium goodii]MBU8825034.1 PE domain-containing protein [Mycolicibacterium goodii]MBU8838496.1 PE domain-containing protein [Mycolicibacterium goodii]